MLADSTAFAHSELSKMQLSFVFTSYSDLSFAGLTVTSCVEGASIEGASTEGAISISIQSSSFCFGESRVLCTGLSTKVGQKARERSVKASLFCEVLLQFKQQILVCSFPPNICSIKVFSLLPQPLLSFVQ
ncbi:hypothetical protein XELAEV_18005532mg [Xenopus laevis]|uniref:Uncharacterized protein n=1 Tax=Xenopus laevis TaxID=8355 RepID=A0A974I3F7_XENLA|nr:hypothetical protein XELAEV_18005532mg [Xenopus laevis]